MRDQLIACGLWDANDPRDPSQDFSAAFAVVEKLDLFRDAMYGRGDGLKLQRGESGKWEIGYRLGIITHRAETVPLVICLAALDFASLLTRKAPLEDSDSVRSTIDPLIGERT